MTRRKKSKFNAEEIAEGIIKHIETEVCPPETVSSGEYVEVLRELLWRIQGRIED